MKKRMMFVLVILFSISKIMAQSVSGVVVDAQNQPLPGVSVVVKGTTMGTITNVNGKFTLDHISNVAAQTLDFSFIGFQKEERLIGQNTNMRIIMREESKQMNEVVVVGYGVQKKSVITGAISKVDANQVLNGEPTRIEDALQGKVSGVQITSASGQPGSGSVVRIRGTGTINNSDPLYIVDGMPVGGGIDYLNPADIASIEVLKDAASAAIYGARAANGVILVTTKQGQAGKTVVSYNFTYGWQNPWRKENVLNASQYEMIMNEALTNAGLPMQYPNPSAAGVGTDWQDAIFYKNAPIVNHEVSVSGGSQKGTYFLSFGYLNQDGIVAKGKSQYERYNIRFNNRYNLYEDLTSNVLRSVTVGANMGYTRTTSSGIDVNNEFGGPLMDAIATPPNQAVYQDDPTIIAQYNAAHPGQVLVSPTGRVYNIIDGNQEIINPVAQLQTIFGYNNADKIVSSFFAEAEFIKGLKLRTSYDVDLAFWGYTGATPAYYLSVIRNNAQSSVNTSMNRGFDYNWENTLSYTRSIQKHNFTVLVGTTLNKYNTQDVGGSNINLQTFDPSKFYLNYALGLIANQASWGGAGQHALASYFGRLTYNYDEKYLLEGVLRTDGSSNFGAANHWGYFPSVSAGWVLTRESFMQPSSNWLDFLKLRGSWGVNGNENIGAFQYTALMSSGSNYSVGNGAAAVIQTGMKPAQLINPDVKWEQSTQTDIGLDARFFNSALSLTFDYFNKKTTGMLMTMSIPAYVGDAAPVGNVGSMTNTGVEFDASYKWDVNKFRFSVDANASYVKNHVDNLGNANGILYLQTLGTQGYISVDQNGQPANSFYGLIAQGIFQNQDQINSYVNAKGQKVQPNAKPGDVIFKDINGDGVIDSNDRTIIGNPNPSWTYGLNFTAAYQGIDFMMFWSGVTGSQIFDGRRRNDLGSVNYTSDILNRWTGPGTSNTMPRVTYGGADPNNNEQPSTLNIHCGNYLRLKAIQLGYTIPMNITKKFFVSKLRAFVNVDNLFTITPYHGFDPEIGANMGVDKGIYPQARTVSVGANISF